MEINNTDDNNILSKTAITLLSDFKDKIASEGVISRDIVISIENILGESVITKEYPINSFSSIPSLTGVKEVIQLINKTLPLDEINTITPTEVSNLINKCLLAMINVKRVVNNINEKLITNKESLDKALTTKIYDVYNNLISISDVNMNEITPEVSNILTGAGIDGESLSYLNKEVLMLKLFNVLSDDVYLPSDLSKVVLKTYTIGDVVSILTNVNLSSNINDAIDYITHALKRLVSSENTDLPYTKKLHKMYSMYNDYISCKDSWLVLNAFYNK